MLISDWSSDVCSSDLPTIINNPLVYVESLVFSNAGFDSDNFHAIVNGIVEAIRRAHANLEAHSQSGSIRMSVSQLLDANVNRSPPAYRQDAASERAQDRKSTRLNSSH